MDIPQPVPGLVIRYAYLWADEHALGQEEGSKDRPAAVLVAHEARDGQLTAAVLPVTHTPPSQPFEALEIPATIKRRLGLDDQRSWIVLTELNYFVWPGPDIRPVPAKSPSTVAYGILPGNLMRNVRDQLLANQAAGRVRQIRRTE